MQIKCNMMQCPQNPQQCKLITLNSDIKTFNCMGARTITAGVGGCGGAGVVGCQFSKELVLSLLRAQPMAWAIRSTDLFRANLYGELSKQTSDHLVNFESMRTSLSSWDWNRTTLCNIQGCKWPHMTKPSLSFTEIKGIKTRINIWHLYYFSH